MNYKVKTIDQLNPYKEIVICGQPVVSDTEPTIETVGEALWDGLVWYNPSSDVSKMYVSGAFRDIGGGGSGEYLPLSGGNLTGKLFIMDKEAATVEYVDQKIWWGTEDEYEEAKASGEILDTTICIITDDNLIDSRTYVKSVNGKTGTVVLKLSDIANSNEFVSSVNGETGAVTQTLQDIINADTTVAPSYTFKDGTTIASVRYNDNAKPNIRLYNPNSALRFDIMNEIGTTQSLTLRSINSNTLDSQASLKLYSTGLLKAMLSSSINNNDKNYYDVITASGYQPFVNRFYSYYNSLFTMHDFFKYYDSSGNYNTGYIVFELPQNLRFTATINVNTYSQSFVLTVSGYTHTGSAWYSGHSHCTGYYSNGYKSPTVQFATRNSDGKRCIILKSGNDSLNWGQYLNIVIPQLIITSVSQITINPWVMTIESDISDYTIDITPSSQTDFYSKSGPELTWNSSTNNLKIAGTLDVGDYFSVSQNMSYTTLSNSGLGLSLRCPSGYVRVYGNSTQDMLYNDKVILTESNYSEYMNYLPLSGGTLTGQLTLPTIRLTQTTDASLTSTGHAFQIGPTSGINLIIDGDELITRNNGSASVFRINYTGGDVTIGGGVSASTVSLLGKLNLDNCQISTQNITYRSSDNTARHVITFVESTNPSSYGVGLKLGGGQGTIVAAGECGYTALTDDTINIGETEQLFLMSDTNVRIFTNANTYDSKHVWIMNRTPTFYMDGATTTGKGNIGASSNRWASVHASAVYSNGSAVSTSDERLKKNIHPIEDRMSAKDFIMALNPVEYKYKASIGTSNRKHYGFIAQDVKSIIDSQELGDIGMYIESPTDETKDLKDCTYDEVELGLRYEEFIAPIVKLLQEQQSTIDTLSKKIASLESKFSN